MNGKILDTNIVIAFFSNEKTVVERISALKDIIIPSVVIGELFYGVEKSGRKEQNLSHLEFFIQTISVLPCEITTVRQYGRIKMQLKSQGTPIPENDIWIAALAMEYDLTLISRDSHFANIEGLSLEAW